MISFPKGSWLGITVVPLSVSIPRSIVVFFPFESEPNGRIFRPSVERLPIYLLFASRNNRAILYQTQGQW